MMSTPLLSVFSLNRRAAIKLAGLAILASLATVGLTGEIRGAEPVRDPIASAVAPLKTEFVYEALVTIAPAVEVGPSSHGKRRYIPITGGTFRGPKLEGTVQSGGADWQLERPDGVTEVDALYSMTCADGEVIIVHNHGLIAANGTYLRTSPSFEAPSGPHAWLNQSVFVGSISGAPQPGAVIIRVFRVL